METRSLHNRPDTLLNTAKSKNSVNADDKSNSASIQPDLNQSSGVAAAETLSLSNASLKLASSVHSSKTEAQPALQNSDQAQQKLKQLLSGFQQNPVQASNTYHDIMPGTVKTLLA